MTVGLLLEWVILVWSVDVVWLSMSSCSARHTPDDKPKHLAKQCQLARAIYVTCLLRLISRSAAITNTILVAGNDCHVVAVVGGLAALVLLRSKQFGLQNLDG